MPQNLAVHRKRHLRLSSGFRKVCTGCKTTRVMIWSCLRVRNYISDLNELNLPKTCNTEFPDPDDLLHFKLIICPDEGFYKGGYFVFNFKVGPNYPHEPPKVKCETRVYHPNIDLEGNVCLNILREDWKPVLTINSVVYGLQYLFLEPNPEDPLNKEAAEILQTNRRLFEHNVSKAMRGSYIGDTYFERCLK